MELHFFLTVKQLAHNWNYDDSRLYSTLSGLATSTEILMGHENYSSWDRCFYLKTCLLASMDFCLFLSFFVCLFARSFLGCWVGGWVGLFFLKTCLCC